MRIQKHPIAIAVTCKPRRGATTLSFGLAQDTSFVLADEYELTLPIHLVHAGILAHSSFKPSTTPAR